MRFTENILRFEALTKTPLKDVFTGLSWDRQLELSDYVLNEVKLSAHGKPVNLIYWSVFKKKADWTAIGKSALNQNNA